MKILLISGNMSASPYPVYPLGLGVIAGVLQREGHAVKIFDILQHNGSLESLRETLRAWPPELVGISIRNIDNVNLLHEQRYLDIIRQIVGITRQATSARIVLGGSGFSLMPEAILDDVGADFGIVGEGEELIVEFVKGAARRQYPSRRCLRAVPRLQGRELPAACYDPDVLGFYLKSGHLASLQTKRGCTHKCVYCTYPFLEGVTLRPRDPAAVVDDMLRLQTELQAKYLFFTDSVFNDADGHYSALLDEMERRGVNIPWTAFFKPDAA